MKRGIIIIVIIAIVILVIAPYFLFPGNWNLKSCQEECQHRGYNLGDCLWPTEAGKDFENIGSCLTAGRHCGNEGECNCYCYNQQLIGGCGGVHPDYIEECCERLATENNIVKPTCVGHWQVREGKCEWGCTSV